MIKLGSLFDGSGGFPLAGALSGIVPVWASEVEPYPIAVTRSRFPRMRHLGSVTEVHGGEIEPVDVITFGSPCQDLSVAGKRAGIHEGERSSLFFQAIRIIREMREKTHGRYPTFAVWENVPGAFSSNKGEDFRCVLQEFIEICGDGTVPRPAGGKWKSAGEIVGDGFSIAWRQLDAQYWGVPQRRKRIYLVADFAGQCAGEILFERESLRGYPAPSGAPGQGAAADTAGSAGGSGGVRRVNPIYTLQGNGIDRADTAGFNGKGWREGVSYTLNTIDRPAICFHLQQDPISSEISPCLGGQGQATVGVFMGGQGAKAGGIGYSESVSPTLKSAPSGSNTVPALIYDARGNGDGARCPTLTGDHQNRVTDYTAVCVCRQTKIGEFANDGNACTLAARDYKSARNLVVEIKPPRKYIIRRLTPLECCRLQGFPDGWGVPDFKPTLTEDELAFWQGVRDTQAAIGGKPPKTYSAASLTKWYNALHTDSAEYKMWGNGIALPCASFVLEGVAEKLKE